MTHYNPSPAPKPRVRAVHCDHRAGDEEVYQALRRATDQLTHAWEKLEKARTIAIKFNQEGDRAKRVTHRGHLQQLVADPVTRAVLRLLRERTTAELYAVDYGVLDLPPGKSREYLSTNLHILREFGVPYRDGSAGAVDWVGVPGGQMFARYPVPRDAAQADALVSVQTLKNHYFMGVTLSLKNLFGLVPTPPRGRPRQYYHHLVRMPYMLADIARIFNPALNIIDGLVGQAGEEWGRGEHPRVANMLAAGDQVVATDACVTHLMGHDPAADWLTPPFHRERNHLLVAASGGFGTVNLSEIDFSSEVQAPLGQFFAKLNEPLERLIAARRTTAEQALFYRDNRAKIAERYAGKYVQIQMGQVQWTSDSGDLYEGRSKLAKSHPDQGIFLKYVDPEETEGEQYQVYEKTLEQMKRMQEAA